MRNSETPAGDQMAVEDMSMGRRLKGLAGVAGLSLGALVVVAFVSRVAMVVLDSARANRLRERILNAKPQERLKLVEQLGRHGHPGKAALLGLLQHQSWHVRAKAASAVGSVADRKALRAMYACLQDECWVVRAAAMHGLRDFVSRNGGESLDEDRLLASLRDGSTEVRVRCVRLLGLARLRSVATVRALVSCLENDPSAIVRGNAVGVIGVLRAREATPSLCRALQDACPAVRETALLSLCSMADRRASRWLVPLLEDSRPTIRLYAAKALCSCGDDDAVPALRELLSDGVEEHSLVAIRALKEMRSPKASAAIPSALAHSSPLVRTLAIRGIAEADDPRLVGHLVSSLRDPSRHVREEACLAIWKITGKGFDGTDNGPQAILEWWQKEGKQEYGQGDGANAQHPTPNGPEGSHGGHGGRQRAGTGR